MKSLRKPRERLEMLREIRREFEQRVQDAAVDLEAIDRVIGVLSYQLAAERDVAEAEEVEAMIAGMLREEGPLTRRQIAQRLYDRGVTVEGSHQLGTLSGILSRSTRMEQFPGGVWGLNGPEEDVDAAEDGD